MACKRNAAVRAEALRLAADLLPAALLLNMDPFMHDRSEVDPRDTPLPEPLFFTFLQAEYNLCEALQGQLSKEERHGLLRKLVPLVQGTLEASGYGYGYTYLASIGALGLLLVWRMLGWGAARRARPMTAVPARSARLPCCRWHCRGLHLLPPALHTTRQATTA